MSSLVRTRRSATLIVMVIWAMALSLNAVPASAASISAPPQASCNGSSVSAAGRQAQVVRCCSQPAVTTIDKANRIADCAYTQIGVPYVAGAMNPSYSTNPGFDCSKFTTWTMFWSGISLTALAKTQWTQAAVLPTPTGEYRVAQYSRSQGMPRRGDLVFFTAAPGGAANTIDHVGIFIGGTGADYDLYIHAPGTGYKVMTSHLMSGSGSLPSRYFGFARYF